MKLKITNIFLVVALSLQAVALYFNFQTLRNLQETDRLLTRPPLAKCKAENTGPGVWTFTPCDASKKQWHDPMRCAGLKEGQLPCAVEMIFARAGK